MTKQTEAMKLALEALTHLQPTALASFYTIGDRDKAITALREALAEQPAQPLKCRTEACVHENSINVCRKCVNSSEFLPWTEQPAQPSKPLTDEQLYQVFPAIATYTEANKTLYRSIARAIEAAHGIKENT